MFRYCEDNTYIIVIVTFLSFLRRLWLSLWGRYCFEKTLVYIVDWLLQWSKDFSDTTVFGWPTLTMHVLFGTKMMALLLGSMVFCLYRKTSGSAANLLCEVWRKQWDSLCCMHLLQLLLETCLTKTSKLETVRFFCTDNFWFTHKTCRMCTVMKLDSQFHDVNIFRRVQTWGTCFIKSVIQFMSTPLLQVDKSFHFDNQGSHLIFEEVAAWILPCLRRLHHHS